MPSLKPVMRMRLEQEGRGVAVFLPKMSVHVAGIQVPQKEIVELKAFNRQQLDLIRKQDAIHRAELEERSRVEWREQRENAEKLKRSQRTIESKEKDIDRLKDQLESKERNCRTLQEEVASLRNTEVLSSSSSDDISQVHFSKRERNMAIRNSELSYRIRMLEDNIGTLKEQKRSLQRNLYSAREELNPVKDHNEKLKLQLNDAKSTLRSREKKMNQLSKTILDLKSARQQLQEDYDKQQKQMHQCNTQTAELRSQIKRLTTKNEKLREDCNQYYARMKELEEENVQEQLKYASLPTSPAPTVSDDDYLSLSGSSSSLLLLQQLDQLEFNKDEIEVKYNDLQAKYDKMKNEYKNTRERCKVLQRYYQQSQLQGNTVQVQRRLSFHVLAMEREVHLLRSTRSENVVDEERSKWSMMALDAKLKEHLDRIAVLEEFILYQGNVLTVSDSQWKLQYNKLANFFFAVPFETQQLPLVANYTSVEDENLNSEHEVISIQEDYNSFSDDSSKSTESTTSLSEEKIVDQNNSEVPFNQVLSTPDTLSACSKAMQTQDYNKPHQTQDVLHGESTVIHRKCDPHHVEKTTQDSVETLATTSHRAVSVASLENITTKASEMEELLPAILPPSVIAEQHVSEHHTISIKSPSPSSTTFTSTICEQDSQNAGNDSQQRDFIAAMESQLLQKENKISQLQDYVMYQSSLLLQAEETSKDLLLKTQEVNNQLLLEERRNRELLKLEVERVSHLLHQAVEKNEELRSLGEECDGEERNKNLLSQVEETNKELLCRAEERTAQLLHQAEKRYTEFLHHMEEKNKNGGLLIKKKDKMIEHLQSELAEKREPVYKTIDQLPKVDQIDQELTRLFVVVMDYDPHSLCITGQPDIELCLQSGSVLLVTGAMNEHGYYTARCNGKVGIVPANFVQEIDTCNAKWATSQLDKLNQFDTTTVMDTSGHETHTRRSNNKELDETTQFKTTTEMASDHSSVDISAKAVEYTSGSYRWHLALCDYNPSQSSSSVYPEFELQFKEGELLKIYGKEMSDGYLVGELNNKRGFVPATLIVDISSTENWISRCHISSKKMIALYDYKPEKDSPNPHPELEISFKAGDIMTVYGNMHKDGFYSGQLEGKIGLIPSNFMKDLTDFA